MLTLHVPLRCPALPGPQFPVHREGQKGHVHVPSKSWGQADFGTASRSDSSSYSGVWRRINATRP